jgi:hypothetical protein
MKTKFSAKLFTNKKNNQITLIIPRKKIKFPNNKVPKELKLKIEEIKW